MNTRNIIIVLVLLIVGIGLTSARADVIKDGIAEAKYEIKAFNEETVPAVVADVKALPENTKTWLDSEVEKTKKFQKESWADAKKQTANTVNKIKGFFTGLNKKAE
tara:strand:- start:341 stop:658 length:318 start_codon:yes stop_codon:yes gene_type:complete